MRHKQIKEEGLHTVIRCYVYMSSYNAEYEKKEKNKLKIKNQQQLMTIV